MLRRYDYHEVTWIDLESPTADEIETVMTEFALPSALEEELISPTEKPRVDLYHDCAYAVFHFPAIRHTHEKDMAYELDVIIGKNYLVTTHYLPMNAIDDFTQSIEAAVLLDRGTPSSASFLFELTDRLYRQSEDELDALEENIGKIEKQIFLGQERRMVVAISHASRELLVHRRILGNHAETLRALETATASFLEPSAAEYFRAVARLHLRAYNRAVSMAEMVTELRDTNTALLSTRQNEITKNLTIIASIMLPLSLLANIFSMNTLYLPIVGMEHDFWIVTGLMLVVTLAFALYFKAKKWF